MDATSALAMLRDSAEGSAIQDVYRTKIKDNPKAILQAFDTKKIYEMMTSKTTYVYFAFLQHDSFSIA